MVPIFSFDCVVLDFGAGSRDESRDGDPAAFIYKGFLERQLKS